ncbi:MAG: protein-glutamate O-methyltransferase CheR [Spirochaetales bacterium]|nr:protein-glutamate O-methyltransferase CheR [Spirochaetales bacterium]
MDYLGEAVYRVSGYDFRQYAKASFRRRVMKFAQDEGFSSIAHLTAEILHDRNLVEVLIGAISVTTSEMFRNPPIFLYLRDKVIPYLKTFPHVRIWHAACANGEEVFSLAILLKEEGLYDHCKIYATDMNDTALANVQKGLFPLSRMQQYSRNYQQAGGKSTLSDYYRAKYDSALFSKDLLKNITFSNHNLTVDGVFMETHLILCRNVLIYFNQELQNRVLDLFYDSLINGGILCLGNRESLDFSSAKDRFLPLNRDFRVFRKEPGAHG